MNLRERLLAAAARIYSCHGYLGSTTRRIAQEAGVNEVTLFRHFGSKDALIHEAVERAGFGTEWGQLPQEPGDPAAEILAWARAYIAEMRAHRSLIRTCMGEMEVRPEILPNDAPPVRAAERLEAYLQRMRERGMASGEFDACAATIMLMGVLFADAMGRDVMPKVYRNDPDEAVQDYVSLFLRGIGYSLTPVRAAE